MKKRKSQNEMVLAVLKSGKAISPWKALRDLGCFRLGARIWELRRAGHRISSRWIERRNRFGVMVRLREYFIYKDDPRLEKLTRAAARRWVKSNIRRA